MLTAKRRWGRRKNWRKQSKEFIIIVCLECLSPDLCCLCFSTALKIHRKTLHVATATYDHIRKKYVKIPKISPQGTSSILLRYFPVSYSKTCLIAQEGDLIRSAQLTTIKWIGSGITLKTNATSIALTAHKK